VEDHELFEAKWKRPGRPDYKSGITIPITPSEVLRVKTVWNLPLHPGAEKYYKEKGYL
jgi:hypothetical protein